MCLNKGRCYALGSNTAILATDTLGQMLGKLQGQIDALWTALAGKEPSITAGTAAQYWRGDKTWHTMPSGDSHRFNGSFYTPLTWTGSDYPTSLSVLTTQVGVGTVYYVPRRFYEDATFDRIGIWTSAGRLPNEVHFAICKINESQTGLEVISGAVVVMTSASSGDIRANINLTVKKGDVLYIAMMYKTVVGGSTAAFSVSMLRSGTIAGGYALSGTPDSLPVNTLYQTSYFQQSQATISGGLFGTTTNNGLIALTANDYPDIRLRRAQ